MSKTLSKCSACGYPAKSREECYNCGYVSGDDRGIYKEHREKTFDTLVDQLLQSNEAFALERLALTETQFNNSHGGEG